MGIYFLFFRMLLSKDMVVKGHFFPTKHSQICFLFLDKKSSSKIYIIPWRIFQNLTHPLKALWDPILIFFSLCWGSHWQSLSLGSLKSYVLIYSFFFYLLWPLPPPLIRRQNALTFWSSSWPPPQTFDHVLLHFNLTTSCWRNMFKLWTKSSHISTSWISLSHVFLHPLEQTQNWIGAG